MRLRHAMPMLLAALLLGACHGKDETAQEGGSTPQAALQASFDLLRAGDFDRLWKQALPPADYANLRADWRLQQRDMPPGSARDRARLDQAMRELTGPDAEHRLYAELQPKLAAMERQYRDQLPVLISVGEAVLKSGIAQSRTLSDAQKTQLDGALDALLPWAQQAPWFDQARAKQAVGVAVATARQLDLKDPGQLHAMDFDASMAKYAVAWGGLKQVLAIYGLSADDAFDSVKLTPLAKDNGRAVVKIDYTLLGKRLSAETVLVQENGRWYSEDLLRNARRSHRQLQQPAAAGSAASAVAQD